MASLPYVTSPGNIDKALSAIKQASVPTVVSIDFVKTILKIPGGSGDQMTSFLKKLGLANPDGSPSDLYRKFRNPSSAGAAIAQCIKGAYAALFTRNEYAYRLGDTELLGLVVEETGEAHDSNSVRLIVSCFKHLKAHANFEETTPADAEEKSSTRVTPKVASTPTETGPDRSSAIGLNLGYIINLNLPATSDPAVFDAIFRSLKQNLLSNDDA